MISDDLAKRLTIALPKSFRYFRDEGGGDLPPWQFMDDEDAMETREIVAVIYPYHSEVLPFASDLSSDDLAVFVRGGLGRNIHMRAQPGWESPGAPVSFPDWFRETVEQTIHHMSRLRDDE